MYKIYKTPITGFDIPGYEDIEIGKASNYRLTMGYNADDKAITVSVDKIIKEDLTRDEDVEVSYVHVTSRTFTPADFVQYTDNMAWIVEFDRDNETINDPFNVLAYTKNLISGSNTHQQIYKLIKERHSGKLIPCFQIESFYKSVTDFSASVLTFHTDVSDSVHDTIITSETPSQTELNTKDRIKDIAINYVTNIIYQILDDNDNVVTSKVPTSPFGNDLEQGELYRKIRGNQYVIDLPADSSYKIRVNYQTGYSDKTVSVQYDVNCVNGIPSKTRLRSGLRAGQTDSLANLNAPNTAAKNAGYEDVIIDNKLSAGDYIKFKLNCGDQITYSELMINLV